MNESTDPGTGEESSDFERWGSEIAGPQESAPAARSRGLGDLSPVRVVAFAITAAALAALIAHFATGGSSRSTAGNPRSHAAIASAVNVRLADLTGFHVSSNAGVSVGGDPSTVLERCFGSNLAAATNVASPDFISGTGLQFVSLDSTVGFATPAVLASEAALAANSRFAPCVASGLAGLTYRAHGLAITSGGGAQATPLTLPSAHGRDTHTILGVRASMTWSVNGLNFPVFVDLYVVTLGREELSLFVLSSQQPYSIATENRLVALLESRALLNPH